MENTEPKNDAIAKRQNPKKSPKIDEPADTKKPEVIQNKLVNNTEQKQKEKKGIENKVRVESDSKAEEKEQRRKEWEAKLKEQNKELANEKEAPSKAELRAKRREMQEAQRLAKEASKSLPETKPKPEPIKPPVKKETPKTTTISKVQLVHHLYSEDTKKYEDENCSANIRGVHPAFRKLGIQYASNVILGSNARCLALLAALKELIDDLTTPPKQEFCRHLESTLQHCVAYLQHCRPFAVSMTNALRHFKLQLTQVDTNLSDNEKKARLIDVVDTYFQDDITKAGEAISMTVNEKICSGDVILTYGW